jgi:putative ABC transport system permease protein
MKGMDILGYSTSSITMQKARAVLTILSVVIGITAIVATTSLGRGYESNVKAQFERSFPTNLIAITSAGSTLGGSSGLNLQVGDTTELDSIPQVDFAVAIMQESVNMSVLGVNVTTFLVGVDFGLYQTMFHTFSTAGGQGSITNDNASFVIGYRLYKPQNSAQIGVPVGNNLTIYWQNQNGTGIKYHSYTANVTGALGMIGGSAVYGSPSDLDIYLPIGTMMTLFSTSEVTLILISLDNNSASTVSSVSAGINAYYGTNVPVVTLTAILNAYNSIFATVDGFLLAIAVICLLVAGVGILNIMTITVTQRTREIGILKSLGAKNQSVLAIFLVETTIIGFFGSLIGIGTGWIVATLLGMLISNGSITTTGRVGTVMQAVLSSGITPVFTVGLIVEAIVFGMAVAIVFGLYPAWKASKKPPVEALRFE